ncbi:hypothetical protein ISN44_As02g006310 [Arabidopsis suecica]|uniref:Arabidopsis retrotransposon Orf1 C-terminal domain-containing protein n=1 Tax=Arabidopsis suecica TaxID=45249 RepID=A0A8T2FY44_ARASU|nr:hypothetical protein ISN44_As02g006310 [Arabidopsis suecica]
MSNYSGESSMDPDYNVDEAESWSARPREQNVYQSFRDEFERSAARRNQRRAEIARGKRAMSSRYELIDEDIETEYEPESWRKETKLLNKPDEVTVEEYIRFFEMNDFWGTRYPCYETLAQLGLLEDVQHLFEKCHLETLMSYPYPAYKEETIEFLSTLQVEMYEALTDFELDTMGLGFLTFSVNEQWYQLSIKKLEELFGFPSGKGTKPRFDREELKDLWATIGNNLPLNSARSKSNQIRSPVIREHIPPARESRSLSEAHRNNSKLQKWCMKQDKLLAKCLRAIKFMKNKLGCSSSTTAIPQGHLPQDMPSRRYDAPEPSQRRPEPREQEIPHVPARHSSFEPRESGRKRRTTLTRSSSRSGRLLQSRSLRDRGAGRNRRREVEFPHSGAGRSRRREVKFSSERCWPPES